MADQKMEKKRSDLHFLAFTFIDFMESDWKM